MYKKQARAAQAKAVLKFFDWSYRNGGKAAMELHYVPMPEAVVKMVEDTWKREIKDSAGKSIWK